MPHILLTVPTGHGVGLTSASLALVRAFDRQGVRVAFCKPIAQPRPGDSGPERSSALVALASALQPPEPLSLARVEQLLAVGDDQRLMEEVVARCEPLFAQADVIVVEGLVPSTELTYSSRINQALSRTLDAEVVLVGRPTAQAAQAADDVAEAMAIAAGLYADGESHRVVGCILNQVVGGSAHCAALVQAMNARGLRVIGTFPVIEQLTRIRIADLVRQVKPTVLVAGEQNRRIHRVTVLAQSVPNVLKALQPGSLLITPGDRHDVIMAVGLAAMSGVRFAGLLLTAVPLDPAVAELTATAFATGLPVLTVTTSTYDTASQVHAVDREVAADDRERAELVMSGLADHLDAAWVQQLCATARHRRLSPPAFRHRVIERARAANRRIVLPEGAEPRTIKAAIQCQERGIARCVLLGNPDEIRQQVRALGAVLPPGLDIIDAAAVAERYVAPLVELRKAKGMTDGRAREELSDPITIGTMMLKLGEVDGLVSGAVHSTAHTIRPALQLIKTAPGSTLVSSVFFMCLPDQVVVYGDCAVNPDPTAEQLADIAIQSADSASAFGIEPQVAMISYSTGTSGSGSDVDKVREATRLVRLRRPDLAIDGPLQYDAAVMVSVAKTKLPGSTVAGHATVFVFPDLNTGNTVYKAVQRSASVVSIGPMLQGLAKPVNDLSRGALVEDIVYTIALTAIQAV